MSKKIPKRLVLFLLAVLAMVAGGFGVTMRFFPLEARALQTRWDLWRGGVQSLESPQKVGGWVADRCHGKEAAQCTCVALIHGLGDEATTWKRVLLWEKWVDPIRFYAFDLPGSGSSRAPEDASELRVRNQAQKLRQAMAPLCPRWVVVGNSLGGWVGAWLALEWPEGVSKLMLVGADLLSPSERNVEWALNPTVEGMREFQKRAYHNPRPIPEYVWPHVIERMKHSTSAPALKAQTSEDLIDPARLASLKTPVMLFWGASDRISAPDGAEKIQAVLPSAIVRKIPQCGHLPQKECPLPLIQAINDFVKLGFM